MTVRRIWRLGVRKTPFDFLPHSRCHWKHRFDDIQEEYRTLYCAETKSTCLREVLADLRPNTTVHEEFHNLFGSTDGGVLAAGIVSSEWRKLHVLAEGSLICDSSDLVDIEAISIRRTLEKEHASLLRKNGINNLDLSEITSDKRDVTRTISRDLFNKGYAGIKFRSRLDNGICYALFEGRAHIKQLGSSISMTKNIKELVTVAGEFTLVLRPVEES